MSNRGLTMISVVSGLIAVTVFIFVIVAYLGSGGSVVSSVAPVAKATPGQPVDSDFVFTSGGNQAPSPAATAQPVNPPAGQQAAAAPTTQEPVEAPSASAPSNPFTAGIH
jgi:hypothetical protein